MSEKSNNPQVVDYGNETGLSPAHKRQVVDVSGLWGKKTKVAPPIRQYLGDDSDPDKSVYIRLENVPAHTGLNEDRVVKENLNGITTHTNDAATTASKVEAVQNPNDGRLDLEHLEKLVAPLMRLIQSRYPGPNKPARPLSNLTITPQKAPHHAGDEDLLQADIDEITKFLDTQAYSKLAEPVKKAITDYLVYQKQQLALLTVEPAESTVRFYPEPKPKAPPATGLKAWFKKRFGKES